MAPAWQTVGSRNRQLEIGVRGGEADAGVYALSDADPVGSSPVAKDGVHFGADKRAVAV